VLGVWRCIFYRTLPLSPRDPGWFPRQSRINRRTSEGSSCPVVVICSRSPLDRDHLGTFSNLCDLRHNEHPQDTTSLHLASAEDRRLILVPVSAIRSQPLSTLPLLVWSVDFKPRHARRRSQLANWLSIPYHIQTSTASTVIHTCSQIFVDLLLN
jgi:hypothetical protein